MAVPLIRLANITAFVYNYYYSKLDAASYSELDKWWTERNVSSGIGKMGT